MTAAVKRTAVSVPAPMRARPKTEGIVGPWAWVLALECEINNEDVEDSEVWLHLSDGGVLHTEVAEIQYLLEGYWRGL